jgi:small subunit ribosomal protein S20
MPVIKSARKKLRQDKKRQKRNNEVKLAFRDAIKVAQKSKTADKVTKAVKLTDKAVKSKLIHKNKAARIKSRLSKLVKSSPAKATVEKVAPKKAKTNKSKK